MINPHKEKTILYINAKKRKQNIQDKHKKQNKYLDEKDM